MFKSRLIVAALAVIGIGAWAMPVYADEPSEEDIVLQRQWEVQDRMEQSSSPPETVAPERDDVMAVEEAPAAEPAEALPQQDKPKAAAEASEQLRYVGEDELGRYPD